MNQINIPFVDIDGTLTTTKSGKPFKQSPDDIKPLPGSQKAITHFANRGYKIFGVSNQGGCDTIDKSTGKPFKSVDDTVLEMQNTLKLYPEIDSIYFCPKIDGSRYVVVENWENRDGLVIENSKPPFGIGATYRKPSDGLIREIEAIFVILYGVSDPINNQHSLFVGDREEDKQCAANADIHFMWADEWRFKYGSFV
jgi:D-glycero-D-manno-heptose 1,7-bisphosphate phosphatase